jgi:hypothetical protein
VRHGRCEVFPSRQRISTALAKTRAKDRRRALVSGTCAYACMWRYILLCLGKVVDIESEVGSGWGFENLCWGMRLGFVMGSSWACKYLRVMTGVAVISLPVRALVAGGRKQEKNFYPKQVAQKGWEQWVAAGPVQRRLLQESPRHRAKSV